LNNEDTVKDREAGSRAFVRGLLLLALVFALPIFVRGQVPAQLTTENATYLRRLIATGSTEEKRTALFNIRNLRSAEASSIAVPALRDSDELVRATASSSVIFLPREEAARALIPLLNDRAEFVRREASFALGEVGDRSATPPLVRLLEKNKALEVRSAAAGALGRIGDPTAVETLLRILRARPTEDTEFVRRTAARAIGQIAQATGRAGTSVVTPQNFLPQKFKDLEGANAPSSLSIAVPVLLSVLQGRTESDDARREAAFALGAIGDSRAVAALRTAAGSSDPYMAEISREALLKIEQASKVSTSNN
jgi:HEAT repeat protein